MNSLPSQAGPSLSLTLSRIFPRLFPGSCCSTPGNTISHPFTSKKPIHPDGPVPALPSPELCCFPCSCLPPLTDMYVSQLSRYSRAASLFLQQTASHRQLTARLSGAQEQRGKTRSLPSGCSQSQAGQEGTCEPHHARRQADSRVRGRGHAHVICRQLGTGDGHRQILLPAWICQGHHWSKEQALHTSCLPSPYQTYLYRAEQRGKSITIELMCEGEMVQRVSQFSLKAPHLKTNDTHGQV